MKPCLLPAAFLGSVALLSAQNVPPPSSEAEEKPVVLDVFVVDAQGSDDYRAASTTTGTRYNTPLVDLPMQIDVVTERMLRDYAVSTEREMLQYISGVQLETTGSAAQDSRENVSLWVRGMPVSTRLKDGFQHFITVDPATIERIDIVKGPGGALYGQGNLGGVVQSGAIRPGQTFQARARQSFGSFDFSRTEVVATGPIDQKKRFGFALPIIYERSEGSEMWFETDTFTVNPSLTVKISPATKLFLGTELQYYERGQRGVHLITDSGRAPDGSYYGVSIPEWSATNRALALPDQKDFRFWGPDTYYDRRASIHTIRLDHAFSQNLQVWAGFNLETTHLKTRDWNIALRNFDDSSIPVALRTNPEFVKLLRPAYAGTKPQVLDIRPNNEQHDYVITRPTYKSELYYAFNLGSVENRLIAGASYGRTTAGQRSPNTNYYYTAADWAALPLEVQLSRFRSPTDFSSVQRWNEAIIAQYPQGPETSKGNPASMTTAEYYDRNLYLNLQSAFFGGRLQTILGVLDIRSDRQGRVYDADGHFLTENVHRPEPLSAVCPSASIIWRAMDNLRFYVNGMSAVDPGYSYSSYDGNGNPLPAPESENVEVGMRFGVFDSKINFTASYYELKLIDYPRQISSAIQNQLVNPADGTTLTSGFNAWVRSDSTSQGYDLKLDYLPLRNLRINVGFTDADAKITAMDPFVEPANPDPTRLAAQQRFVANGGSSAYYIGTNPNSVGRYSGSGLIRYQFDRGPLKDFWVLFATTYQGSRIRQAVVINTTTGDATISDIKVPSHFTYNMALGYRHKLRGKAVDYQLNVNNLEDDRGFYGSNWQTGITYRLTAGIKF